MHTAFKVMQPDGLDLVCWPSPTSMHQLILYSNLAPVTSGVQQGSVLGPRLFLIYINDQDTNIVSKISKFADDTLLCHRARNPDDIMELQEDINTLVEWANKWQMNFNVDKCSVMQI